MTKSIWLAVVSTLFASALQAQAAPDPKPAKPAAPQAKAAADKSVEWKVDPAHSTIGFTARHLGFSKVNGTFKKFSAEVKADPKTGKISALEATADTASIDTGIDKRDAHLKSDDFLNAEKYPHLKLVLKSIKWSGNKFTAKTELTIRDVTKEVPFKGELLGMHEVNFGQGPQQRAAYEANATISRKEFGLKWNTLTEGIAVVGDPVEINLAVEASYVAPAGTTTTMAPSAAPKAATHAAAVPAKPAATATTAAK